MSQEDAFLAVPALRDIEPKVNKSSPNQIPVGTTLHEYLISENTALVVYIYDRKVTRLLLVIENPKASLREALLKDITKQYGEYSYGVDAGSETKFLQWDHDSVRYSYVLSEKTTLKAFLGAETIPPRDTASASTGATAPTPKKKGEPLVPDTFWKLRPGMSWAEVLSILPGAEAYTSLDGSFPPLTPDTPREDLGFKYSDNEILKLTFVKKQLSQAFLNLYNSDAAYARAIKEQLRSKFSYPPTSGQEPAGEFTYLRWSTDGVHYNLVTPRNSGDLILHFQKSYP